MNDIFFKKSNEMQTVTFEPSFSYKDYHEKVYSVLRYSKCYKVSIAMNPDYKIIDPETFDRHWNICFSYSGDEKNPWLYSCVSLFKYKTKGGRTCYGIATDDETNFRYLKTRVNFRQAFQIALDTLNSEIESRYVEKLPSIFTRMFRFIFGRGRKETIFSFNRQFVDEVGSIFKRLGTSLLKQELL